MTEKEWGEVHRRIVVVRLNDSTKNGLPNKVETVVFHSRAPSRKETKRRYRDRFPCRRRLFGRHREINLPIGSH